jgi:hypothetical protein
MRRVPKPRSQSRGCHPSPTAPMPRLQEARAFAPLASPCRLLVSPGSPPASRGSACGASGHIVCHDREANDEPIVPAVVWEIDVPGLVSAVGMRADAVQDGRRQRSGLPTASVTTSSTLMTRPELRVGGDLSGSIGSGRGRSTSTPRLRRPCRSRPAHRRGIGRSRCYPRIAGRRRRNAPAWRRYV